MSTPDGSKFDVIFVGTSSGQLLKVVNSLAPKSIASTRTVIIEEIEVASFFLFVGIQMIIIFWQVAPQLLIKGVTVVRTAKGSGHVLVTTADQVATLTINIECVLVLVAKKLILFVVGINADHPQSDPVVSPLPLRQGKIMWPVRGSSGEHQSAKAKNISGRECKQKRKMNII